MTDTLVDKAKTTEAVFASNVLGHPQVRQDDELRAAAFKIADALAEFVQLAVRKDA